MLHLHRHSIRVAVRILLLLRGSTALKFAYSRELLCCSILPCESLCGRAHNNSYREQTKGGIMFAPQPILNGAEFSYIYQGLHENCGAPPLFSNICSLLCIELNTSKTIDATNFFPVGLILQSTAFLELAAYFLEMRNYYK